jgi:ABC-type antimicrobial peptide transport system permease subunit
MRRRTFTALLGGLAGALLAIGLAIMIHTASGDSDALATAWAATAYVAINLLALVLAALVVAAVRRSTRLGALTAGLLAIVVVAVPRAPQVARR